MTDDQEDKPKPGPNRRQFEIASSLRAIAPKLGASKTVVDTAADIPAMLYPQEVVEYAALCKEVSTKIETITGRSIWRDKYFADEERAKLSTREGILEITDSVISKAELSYSLLQKIEADPKLKEQCELAHLICSTLENQVSPDSEERFKMGQELEKQLPNETNSRKRSAKFYNWMRGHQKSELKKMGKTMQDIEIGGYLNIMTQEKILDSFNFSWVINRAIEKSSDPKEEYEFLTKHFHEKLVHSTLPDNLHDLIEGRIFSGAKSVLKELDQSPPKEKPTPNDLLVQAHGYGLAADQGFREKEKTRSQHSDSKIRRQ